MAKKITCGGFYFDEDSFEIEFTEDGKPILKSKTTQGVVIQANAHTVIQGYSVPKLTADELVKAYNAVVAGKSCTITDEAGISHFVVNQADMVGDGLTIEILYFSLMLLTYTLENETVTVDFTLLRPTT